MSDQNSNTGRRKRANPLSLRLKPELVQAVNRAAEAAGQSRNAFLRETIEQRLSRDGAQ